MKTTSEIKDLSQPNFLSCRLERGVLAIDGVEAVAFLQGQMTNDLNQITDAMSGLAAVCTPKGRVIAFGRLLRHENGFWWLLPRPLVTRLQIYLSRYLLRTKAMLRDQSDDWALVGVGGEQGAAWLQSRFGIELTAANQAARSAPFYCVRELGDYPRILCFGPTLKIAELAMELAQEFGGSNGAIWQQNDLLTGLPQIYPETSELFIPQSLNLDLLHAVNFKKGCYTGQEIVARTQHLGRIKRRLYLGTVATELAPQPGDALHSPHAAANEETGTVVDSVLLENSDYLLLFSAAKNLISTPLALAKNQAAITRLSLPTDGD